MKFLIQSIPEDIHALAVAIAVQRLGHSVVLWSAPEFAAGINTTVELGPNSGHWLVGHSLQHEMNEIDLVWWRRFRVPPLPAGLHPDDEYFARRENAQFYRGLFYGAAHGARWLHPPADSESAESKIRQLAHAREIGFKIPRTIFSNDPGAIRTFISEVEASGGSVIYKTFSPVAWTHGTGGKTMFAKRVRLEDIDNDFVIRAVPGIYQERVAKSLEVRATLFGDKVIAVGIDSQSDPSAHEDWRASLQLKEILTPIELPDGVSRLCKQIMSSLSLDMACFDFIVDECGEYVFLELNQQGQFLWVEELCESVPMLEEFVRFIERLGGSDESSADRPAISFKEITSSNEYRLIEKEFESNGYVALN